MTTAARCKLQVLTVDDEQIDAVIPQKAEHLFYDGAQLDIQMKCTSRRELVSDSHIDWQLKIKHYNELRSPRRYNPRILLVMLVPESFEKWVVQDESSLQMSHCAYWLDLLNHPEVGTDSVTVKVPLSNVFDVEQLLGILHRIGEGGEP